jgi:TonB family protein
MFRVLAALSALAGAIQPNSSAQITPPPTAWQLGWQDNYCTVTTIDADGVSISLWTPPGYSYSTLHLAGSPEILPDRIKSATVTLAPGADAFQAEADVTTSVQGRTIELNKLMPKFLRAFGNATAVTITGGSKPVSLPIERAGEAIAALQGCVNQRLSEWGADPKQFQALQSPPVLIKPWLSVNNYPDDALHARWSGVAVVRVNVDASGSVTSCGIAVSSGFPSVDEWVCKDAIGKGRFQPAIGAGGVPGPAVAMVPVKMRAQP